MAKRKNTAESGSETKSSGRPLQWYATANRNAYLPDGTFVAAGKKAKITGEYVERLRAANDKTFTITQE